MIKLRTFFSFAEHFYVAGNASTLVSERPDRRQSGADVALVIGHPTTAQAVANSGWCKGVGVPEIERIDRLVNHEGYTLKGAKAALKGVPDQQAAAQEAVAVGGGGETRDIASRLKAIRDDLRAALAA